MSTYRYSYDPATHIITRTDEMRDVTINIQHPAEDEMYLYADCLTGIDPNTAFQSRAAYDNFVSMLCESEHYKQYLSEPSPGGQFDRLPSGWFDRIAAYVLFFSVFVVPYENVDIELRLRPEYSEQIMTAYYASSSTVTQYSMWLIRICKQLIRLLLIAPGILMTPIILIVSIIGLSNMSG